MIILAHASVIPLPAFLALSKMSIHASVNQNVLKPLAIRTKNGMIHNASVYAVKKLNALKT